MNGLRVRILLVGLLSAVIGVLVSRVVVRTVADEVAARFAGGAVMEMMSRAEGARCAATPESWSFVIPGVSDTYAYDPVTFAPRNPSAPPLDRSVLARLTPREGGEVGVRLGSPTQRGVLILRLAQDGPCRLVQTSWRAVGRGNEAVWLYVWLPGSVGVVCVFLSFVIAIGPVVRRVARLRRAAALVGADEGYESVEIDQTDDLGQLGRELDRAHVRIRADAGKLRAEHTALERHLADVAHDLRTPLASLQLAVQHALALNSDISLEDPLRRALADTVYAGGLTENLRLASKLEGAWDPKEVANEDLRALVERVALRMRFFAKQRQIELEVALPDESLFVSCQPVAVEQAVANIVENAVSFGEAGGHVAIVLQRLPGSKFVLTVVDDGPGVRVSELPRLGERTFRSDEARQRAPRGSGFGLAITTAVCERSGWDLSFASEEPEGLRVTVRGTGSPKAP